MTRQYECARCGVVAVPHPIEWTGNDGARRRCEKFVTQEEVDAEIIARTAHLTADFTPGKKLDGGKAAYHLIPPRVLGDLASVLTYGAGKYAPGNWRKVPAARDRYYSAMMRHVEAWRMGQRKDEESGLPHLAHALCCLVFLAAFDSEEISK